MRRNLPSEHRTHAESFGGSTLNAQQNIGPLAIGVEDAYRALGIGRTAFYAMVARGELTLIKIGKRSLVPYADLQRLVATDTTTTRNQAVAK